jgi:hypothetical protein
MGVRRVVRRADAARPLTYGPMNDTPDPLPDETSVPYIAHQEFRSGLPLGRFRVVVNPDLAWPYVMQRTGIVLNRVVKRQAAPILLHLAVNSAAVYRDVTENSIMEVRRS